jgi:hypothetical protein
MTDAQQFPIGAKVRLRGCDYMGACRGREGRAPV